MKTTLFTIIVSAAVSNAAITLAWVENQSTGAVTVTASGSYEVTLVSGSAGSGGADLYVDASHFVAFNGPWNYAFGIGSGSTEATDEFIGAGSFTEKIGWTNALAFGDGTAEVGDVLTYSGTITFAGQSFDTMFGDTAEYTEATSVDYVNFNYTDGSSLISSTALTVVPEPTSWALLGLGGLVLTARRKRS